jgi:flavin reductase ActVB
VFERAGWLAVNILGRDQRNVAARFARKGPEKFRGLATVPGLSGIPLIGGSLATLECSVEKRFTVGDHLMLLSTVRRADSCPGVPLAYHQRDFCGIVK